MSDTIIVKSKFKEYDVEFINDLTSHIFSNFNERAIFVIDSEVYSIYERELSYVTKQFRTVFLTPRESDKTVDYAQEIIEKLLNSAVRKTDILVAIGGGITQDIVAFISSIIFRGVDWAFYPTTLLAQADSCIGSKSSINFKKYKNLLGTFNPPNHIYIYPLFLKSLSESEIRSGIGEMMHYFLNDGLEKAERLMMAYQDILKDVSLITPFIKESLLIKRKIIEVDEFDTSIRHIFNYGHTFGHAIEAITNYEIPHGQAVSIGMNIANYFSLEKGMITRDIFLKMYDLLKLNMPEFKITTENIDTYCAALSKDKKNVGKQLGCILTEGPGKMKKCFLEMDESFKKSLLNYSHLY
jgi:3-dehydroquinate synthase